MNTIAGGRGRVRPEIECNVRVVERVNPKRRHVIAGDLYRWASEDLDRGGRWAEGQRGGGRDGEQVHHRRQGGEGEGGEEV